MLLKQWRLTLVNKCVIERVASLVHGYTIAFLLEHNVHKSVVQVRWTPVQRARHGYDEGAVGCVFNVQLQPRVT